MRALSLVGPREARLIEVPDPEPGPGQVLVRIHGCGVCGSDLNAWRGVTGTEYPLTPGAPGHEAWGSVVGTGPSVSSLAIGDRVTGLMWNGFAELATARAEDVVNVHTDGLLGEPLACAMNVVRRSAIQPGDRLAVVGFGYLAALVVQLLPAGVDEWIAISRREDSRGLALRLGAAAAYDFSDIPARAWDSYSVVIEAAGVQRTLEYATWLTAYGGRLVIAGYHADGPRTVNMQSWNWKGIDVINAHERKPAVYVAALREGMVRVADRPLVELPLSEWSLAEASGAFVAAENRPPGFVKAVIRP